jgi:hypothetical protein
MTYRIALPMLALLMAGSACSDTAVTSPRRSDGRVSASSITVDQGQLPQVAEFAFEKWFTAYPAMTGNTGLGNGTFAGEIVSRTAFANGVIVELEAVYRLTDPSGTQSFTAHIEGTENLETMRAVLNGVITEGWRAGSRVHVTFDVIAPCPIHNRATCFRGTIRVQG